MSKQLIITIVVSIVIAIIVGLLSYYAGRQAIKPQLSSIQDSLVLAKAGWAVDMADLVSQKELNKQLQDKNKDLQGALNGKIGLIAFLEATLEAAGHGEPVIVNQDSLVFNDKRLWFRHLYATKMSDYIIKRRTYSAIVLKVGTVWSSLVTSDLGDTLTLSKFSVSEDKGSFWQNTNIGISAGFLLTPSIGIPIKYKSWSIEPLIGYDDKTIYGGRITRWVK
jgi:hypothetical protein